MSSLSPGLVPMLLALLIPFLRGRLRQAYLLLIPIASYAFLLWLRREVGLEASPVLAVLGYDALPVHIDRLSFVFGTVFHLALFLGLLYSLHVEDPLQHVAACIYAGATIGATFAGDLLLLFVFWEVVALASTFLIWARRTERSYRAGQRYLIVQVASGVLLLAGTLLLAREGHGLRFGPLSLSTGAGKLIFLAFGIKCAFPLLHTWLVDAYPEATPTGTVFLSAFTTKLAVYALARSFAGAPELIWIGAVMTLFPIFYAVIEDDLRRVLSYSMINQIGFMVVGIGLGTKLAIDGAAAHAFADVVFKGLLFMAMGAVLQQTGKVACSELGGLHKAMPFTAACCLVGAASISAFPLTSAFATKSLIMDAAAGQHLVALWFVLLFASAGVLHHAGIKIPFFAFFAYDAGLRPARPPLNMRAAMGLGALLCVGIGCFPGLLYRLLPYPEVAAEYQVYSAYHVVSQLQLLLCAALAFVVLRRKELEPPEIPSTNLDADWVVRRPLYGVWELVRRGAGAVARGFTTLVLETLPRQAAAFVQGYGAERGALRGLSTIGSSILVVLGLLFLFLLVGQGLAPTG
ncbi:MAG: Na(+)/H(+) antiporter subunit D [Planctomycetota bacterium]